MFPQPRIPHWCVCERFIYSDDGSTYSAAGKYVDRSCEYIHGNRSQTHESGNICFQHSVLRNFRCGVCIATSRFIRICRKQTKWWAEMDFSRTIPLSGTTFLSLFRYNHLLIFILGFLKQLQNNTFRFNFYFSFVFLYAIISFWCGKSHLDGCKGHVDFDIVLVALGQSASWLN